MKFKRDTDACIKVIDGTKEQECNLEIGECTLNKYIFLAYHIAIISEDVFRYVSGPDV